MASGVTVVILAAGLGTRMKSRHAKVLHCAGGRPLIQNAVHAALGIAEPERIFVVVGYQADRVKESVAPLGVRFIHQEEQRGTGHAVLSGRADLENLGGLLTIFYGDCPLILPSTLQHLIDHQTKSGGGGTMISTRLMDPTGYGRVVRNEEGDVDAIVEQKAANREQLRLHEINAGIYCFDAPLFWGHIDQMTTNNPAGEYYLTDMVGILIKAGHPIHALKIKDSTELLGINNRIELAAVDRVLRERKAKELMLDGVTIVKPETVTIDAQVKIGIDTVIGPFAQILGNTVIGENCLIGACSVVADSVLEDGVQVAPFTMIGTSHLERDVHAGPYARLRMGNHLAEGVHVGNFVELKNATVGAGSKAMHLTYIGDASVGAGVNVGAGTITCNYDGTRKHRTTIGNRVFVGSNSTLVAPVEAGEGAYIAAGSVITENVPADALAIGRSRQVNKEGYAHRLRKKKQ